MCNYKQISSQKCCETVKKLHTVYIHQNKHTHTQKLKNSQMNSYYLHYVLTALLPMGFVPLLQLLYITNYRPGPIFATLPREVPSCPPSAFRTLPLQGQPQKPKQAINNVEKLQRIIV